MRALCACAMQTEASHPELGLIVVHVMSCTVSDYTCPRVAFHCRFAVLCVVWLMRSVAMVLINKMSYERTLSLSRTSVKEFSAQKVGLRKQWRVSTVSVDRQPICVVYRKFYEYQIRGCWALPLLLLLLLLLLLPPRVCTYCHCCVIADANATLSTWGVNAKLAAAARWCPCSFSHLCGTSRILPSRSLYSAV